MAFVTCKKGETYLPTYIPTNLPTYLPTYLPLHVGICLITERSSICCRPVMQFCVYVRVGIQNSGEIKMSVIPHPPYSPDLAPCDFFLLPKMKLKLEGRRFGTTEEIHAESQSALHWQKRTSRKLSKNGEDVGTDVYMREGTTLRVTTVDRPYGEFYDLYTVSTEYFGYILVCRFVHRICVYRTMYSVTVNVTMLYMFFVRIEGGIAVPIA
jgi:hypothetical protein